MSDITLDKIETMKKTNNYVSEIDQLLAELRITVPESESQREERKKYDRIDRLRDHPTSEEKDDLWEEF
jgi:hypothetical protein